MEPRRRILIHFTARTYGGVESHVRELALLYSRAGHVVHLASHRGIDLPEDVREMLVRHGIRLVRPPRCGGRLQLALARVGMLIRLRRQSYDLVIGQGHGGAFRWMRRYVRSNGQLIWHEHWDGLPTRGDKYQDGYKAPPPEVFNADMRDMIDAVDGILVDSRRARDNLTLIQGVPKEKVRILRPLTTSSVSLPIEDRHYTRDSPISVGLIGRQGRGKGSLVAAKLWRTVDEIQPATLEIWGGVEDKEVARELEEIALADPSVRCHGQFLQGQLDGILKSLDLGLLLAVEEGYGLVVSEYMAAGIPVLMTDVGASSEFGAANPDALVVSVNEEAALDGLIAMIDRIRGGRTSRTRQRNRFERLHASHLSEPEYLELVTSPVSFWARQDHQ